MQLTILPEPLFPACTQPEGLARGERMGHVHSLTHVYEILDCQEYIDIEIEDIKDPCGYLIPQLFLLSYWSSFLFAPTVITPSGSCDVKQLLLIELAPNQVQ